LDPTPTKHQIVEAEAELFISGVFDRRPKIADRLRSPLPQTLIDIGSQRSARLTP
jgi:hypothetical protein